MPTSTPHVPKYRHYKPKNLAVVRIHGHDHYLGPYGSEESRERYRRLVAALFAGRPPETDPTPPRADPAELTINRLLLDYWTQHVAVYYVKHGRPTSEQDNIRQALRFLRHHAGSSPARAFSPRGLNGVRDAMITAGRCRTLINKDVNRIRGLFRWAVEAELLPAEVYQALRAVAPLRRGRSSAREATPIGPVPRDVVDATLRHLSPQVAAMVRLQLLTGARPGEIVALRPR